MKLSSLQIRLIRGDIRQSGVELRDLEDDLLDHMCCAMEEVQLGSNAFEDLYSKVKSDLFPAGYKEIQKTTASLLSQKFRKMKKTMNILGIVGALILLFGALMKNLRLPGAAMLLATGTLTMVFGYFSLMLGIALKNTDIWQGKLRAISGYIGSSMIVSGITLRIFHWSIATPVLLIGVAIFLIIFIPLYLKTVKGEQEIRIGTASVAIIILTITTVFFSTTAIRVSNNFTKSLAEIPNEISRSYTTTHSRLISLRQNVSNPSMVHQTEDILSYLDNMKAYMLTQVNPQQGDSEFSYNQVMYFSQEIDAIMLGQYTDAPYNGLVLKKKLESWSKVVISQNPQLAESIPKIELEEFVGRPFYNVYTKLSKIQLDIVNLEIESIKRS